MGSKSGSGSAGRGSTGAAGRGSSGSTLGTNLGGSPKAAPAAASPTPAVSIPYVSFDVPPTAASFAGGKRMPKGWSRDGSDSAVSAEIRKDGWQYQARVRRVDDKFVDVNVSMKSIGVGSRGQSSTTGFRTTWDELGSRLNHAAPQLARGVKL